MGPVVKACIHCRRELPTRAVRCIFCCASQPESAVDALGKDAPGAAGTDEEYEYRRSIVDLVLQRGGELVPKRSKRGTGLIEPGSRCGLCRGRHATTTCPVLDATVDDAEREQLAYRCYALDELTVAIKLYGPLAEATLHAKQSARFRQRQGGLLETNGEFVRAFAAYEAALRVDADDVLTLHAIGALFITTGQWAQARPIYQRLVAQASRPWLPAVGVSIADTYWALGTCDLKLGAKSVAAHCFVRGLTFEPRNRRIITTLAANFTPDEVKALAESFRAGGLSDNDVTGARKQPPPPPGARIEKESLEHIQRYGRTLEARGDLQGAAAAFQQALLSKPDDVVAISDAARLYYQTSSWENARTLYQSLVNRDTDIGSGVRKADAYWALGNIHLKLGDSNHTAMEMFERGLALEPNHPQLITARAKLRAEEDLDNERATLEAMARIMRDPRRAIAAPVDVEGAPIARATVPDKSIREIVDAATPPASDAMAPTIATEGPDTDADTLFANLVGTTVQRVRATQWLYTTPFAECYAAEHVVTGRRYLLQILPHDKSTDVAEARLCADARDSATSDNPTMAVIDDVGRLPDRRVYLLLSGFEKHVPLAELLDAGPERRMAAERLLEVFIRVAQGLADLHAKGRVHRDLKPENIHVRFGPRGEPIPKLGLPNVMDDADGLSAPFAIAGTPAYLSPEQAINLQHRSGELGRELVKIDARSDLYSLGVVLYKAFAGALPFEGETFERTLAQHIETEPVPVEERAALASRKVHPVLAAVIARCLRKRVEDRFDDAASLASELMTAQEQIRLDEIGHIGVFESILKW